MLGIGLTMMATMLFPQADRAAETLHRMRATELAESVMNEVWSKAFDPNTGNGGVPACSATASNACDYTIGATSSPRNQFDNLNDYNGMTQSANMLNSNQSYADVYPNYQLAVQIIGNAANQTKHIVIRVTTPSNETIRFDAIRSNY